MLSMALVWVSVSCDIRVAAVSLPYLLLRVEGFISAPDTPK